MDQRIRDTITSFETLQRGERLVLKFITPSLACLLAAQRIASGPSGLIAFEGDAQSYARNIGLIDVLNEGPCHGTVSHGGGLKGVSYSPLTQLSDHSDVDRCNKTLNAVLRQLCADLELSRLFKVIGELHDNVPSHANGIGFSMAQVYGETLYFAVADSGKGLLSNVQKTESVIKSDEDAIHWCLKKGNTSAGSRAGHVDLLGPQRVPDQVAKDYGWDQRVFEDDSNHHLGLGLYEMMQLIEATGGSCGIMTGNCVYYQEGSGQPKCATLAGRYSGLAIFIALNKSCLQNSDLLKRVGNKDPRMESLGRELGL